MFEANDLKKIEKPNSKKELNQHYKAILKTSKGGYCLTNLQGRIFKVNRTFCKMCVSKEAKLRTKNIIDFFDSETPIITPSFLKKIRSKTNEQFECRLKRQDDRLINIEANVSFIPYKEGRLIFLIRDTTERSNFQELHQLSETKYKLITEKIRDVVWLMDIKGKSLFVSSSIEKFTGYTVNEYLSQSIQDRFTPASAKLALETLKKEISLAYSPQGPPKNYKKMIIFDYRCKDGGVKTGEVLMTPYFDHNNNFIGIHGVTRDISERIVAEEKLVKSETKYRELIENLRDVVFITKKDGTLTYLSPSIYLLVGYETTELIGINFLKFIHPEDLNFIKKGFAEVLSGKTTPHEYRIIAKDGSIKTVRSSSQPIIKNDEVVGLQGIISDISELKSSELALKNNEKRLRSLFSAMNEGFCIVELIHDNDNHAVDIRFNESNPACEREFERSKDNLIGHTLYEIFPSAESYWIENLENVQLTKKAQYFEAFFSSLNKYFQVNAFRTDLGDIGIMMTNITDRKQAELEIISAKLKAEESDRLKTAFLANMSHEIRTPMNGIMGFTQLLKEPLLKGQDQQKYIGIIEKSGKRLLNIINDIINISKVESGEMELSISETNVNEQTEYIYSFFQHEIEQKGVELRLINSLPSKEAIINTDKEKLYAILTNLVKNSIKFTNNGHIEIGYKLLYSKSKNAQNKISELKFYVNDTGKGIPDDQKELVFERFRQGNESLTRNYEGAGLGLSISKAYVEILGGKIWLESKINEGTTFFFTIPYMNNEDKQIKNKNQSPEITTGSFDKQLKIFIAEDDEASNILLKKMVKSFSRQTLTAGNGLEAVEICRNNPDIDLIFMDIRMPKMSGYEATQNIREFNKEVIIFAQTAFGFERDYKNAIEAGCNDYISKPIGKYVLMSLINKHFK